MNEIKYSNDINSNVYKDSLNIRETVFVNEQNVPKNLEIDNLENKCTYFALYIGNKAVATARFYSMDDNGIHIQRVAVLKEFRQQHLGSELLKFILDYARKQNVSYVILGAQDHAQEFYKKLGFEVIGEQYLEAGILHHDMKLKM